VQIHCEPNQPGQLRYGLRPSLHCPGANQQPGETERPVDQYTYPQLQNQNATIRPGSILNRQGGSKFNRRRQPVVQFLEEAASLVEKILVAIELKATELELFE
jgi:hypothetical protein